jgi:hypothetical protein
MKTNNSDFCTKSKNTQGLLSPLAASRTIISRNGFESQLLIERLLRQNNLTPWEKCYLKAALNTKRRSSKQIEKVEAIALRRMGGAAW